ncbi:MAG: hypothetical protein NW241_02700 [Bacteroidia bacterium]|nr:hypothetical protein [Bacteroidia bacterium]
MYRTPAPQKVFSTGDIAKEWGTFNYANRVNWQDKGYILKLRNTWYACPESIRTDADVFVLANRLYGPSYISLESALRYYNWIPDMVFSITSITTLKSARWKTAAGHFSCRSIHPRFFFGYREVNIQGTRFTIAEPEKTLLLAQKLYAAGNRPRAKGRDFFDIVFLFSLGYKPDYAYLEARMGAGTPDLLRQAVLETLGSIDLDRLAEDVRPFLFSSSEVRKVRYFKKFWEQAAL